MFVTFLIVLVCFVRFFSFFDRAQDDKRSEEVSHFQEQLADAHTQLQILQKQLDDELSKQPLTNQEVQCISVAKQSKVNYLTVCNVLHSQYTCMLVMPYIF